MYRSDCVGILPVELTRDISAQILKYGVIMFLALQDFMNMRDLRESISTLGLVQRIIEYRDQVRMRAGKHG